MPAMMVSITCSEFFAEADVEFARDEEGDDDCEVDQIIHGGKVGQVKEDG